MKSLTILAVSVALLFTFGSADAKEGDTSVEATLGYATESFEGLGSQFGFTIGGGYELKGNFEGRIDLSYLKTSDFKMDMNVTGRRLPIDLGVRYYMPRPKVDENLTLFGQGALEVSFDHIDAIADDRPSADDTNVGLTLGGGAKYMLSPEFGATANMLYHFIKDSYLSIGVGAVYHF